MSKLRSCNLDVKCNFKRKFTFNNVEHLQCSLTGCSEIEDQQHLMKCNLILDKLDNTPEVSNNSYDNIFSDEKRQHKITK